MNSCHRPTPGWLLNHELGERNVEGPLLARFHGITHRDAELLREEPERSERRVALPPLESGEEPEGQDLGGSFLLGEPRHPAGLAQVAADDAHKILELHEA